MAARTASRLRIGLVTMALVALATVGWQDSPPSEAPKSPNPPPDGIPVAAPEAPVATEAQPAAVSSHNIPPDWEHQLPKISEIKPLSMPPIPDNPPPHEGAMIDIPRTVEAPDVLVIDVLEALPGRPIEGERLIRPDGTISLDFYGSIHVSGLTVEQIKVLLVLHLRKYLDDEVLGLIGESVASNQGISQPAPVQLPPVADGPILGLTQPEIALEDLLRHTEAMRKRLGAAEAPKEGAKPVGDGKRRSDFGIAARGGGPMKPMEGLVAPKRSSRDDGGKQAVPQTDSARGPVPEVPPDRVDHGKMRFVIPPSDSDRIFVDIASYNSRVYYVQGAVATPGRFPCTGRETVLDALNNAGGSKETADPRAIRLVRPSRGDQPARVYSIDLEAIIEQGDARANLQIFPGDRLVVGKHSEIPIPRMPVGFAHSVDRPTSSPRRSAQTVGSVSE